MKTLTNFKTTISHFINFKTILSFIALVCFTQIGFGQTTTIDFETENSGYTPSATEGSTFTDVFNRIDRTATALGGNNTFLFAIEDLNTVSDPSILLDQIDVFGSSSFTFSIDMLAHHYNDWDNSDELLITYSVDGGSFQNLMWVQNTGETFNDPAALDLDFDGNGDCGTSTILPSITTGAGNDCTVSSNTFATFITNPITLNNNSTLDIKFQFNGFTAGDEGMYFDNIIIEQNDGSTDPIPGITLSSLSGNTSEEETTATFTTVLDVVPASDVVLDVSSDYPGEISFDLSQLTFTDQNWDTPQTITITGLDDSDVDGDIDVTITVAVDDALSDDSYDGLSATTTVTNEDNELPPLIINEFLADPDGDANGDGTTNTGDDEFIEIYNNTLSDIDVSGYMINDSSGLRHTFPSGSVIPAGEVIVVFGGGTPTNIPCLSQTASVGFLGLNNSGDTITLFDASSVVVTSYSYGSEGGDNQSLGRNVDITGDFIKHSQITSNPVDFSPGRYNETNIPFSAVTWTGATSSDWATTSNWSAGAVPTSSDIVFIDGTFTNEPTISSIDAVAQSVTVASGNTLTIDQSSSLTVSGDFTNSGTVILNSTADDFSSLIVEGSATGDITYNRFVNSYNDGLGGGWDLVCSPVNMTIADFITANGANIQVLGDDYAFSQYDNALGQWVRYATASQTGSFTAGQGYSMATTAGATVAFTGTMQTTDQSIDIINNNGLNGVGRRWNLVSNPFPSYINGNTTAEAVNNFMD
ncbi:lamin tail domain-containing protein, partial [Flavobacteriaceae bacterium]|nr:lamin tail domain-containing protein [Flavobacteriaceae bacterium]